MVYFLISPIVPGIILFRNINGIGGLKWCQGNENNLDHEYENHLDQVQHFLGSYMFSFVFIASERRSIPFSIELSLGNLGKMFQISFEYCYILDICTSDALFPYLCNTVLVLQICVIWTKTKLFIQIVEIIELKFIYE